MGKINKKDDKYIDIYWCIWHHPETEFSRMLMDMRPTRLVSDFIKKRALSPKIPIVNNLQPNGYQTCSAYTNLADNMLILNSPINAKVIFNDNGEIQRDFVHNEWFTERISSFNDSFGFEIDLGYMFFTDSDQLNMTITPPYMHKTSHMNDAYILSVKYDISSWFRPIQLIYQTWDNSNKFELTQGEPVAYLSFDTDKKIRLRQFMLNDRLVNQARACMQYKFFQQFTPINNLYNKFRITGMRKAVLAEIQKNLIE